MKQSAMILVVGILTVLLLSPSAFADSINIGYFSYSVTGSNTAEFDILNGTGTNNSFDPADFTVTNPVSFDDLSLTLVYANGQTLTLG